MITHVVVFWTDKPAADLLPTLLPLAQRLGEIPGVHEFRFGPPVPSRRGVVDDSFSFAISMTFADQAAADAYQQHPIHVEFVEKAVRPYIKRFVVYDFG
ncbi:MAG: hypothetical protein OHK005_05140 [Candidatus Methylacidiphilales bacterium]